jgi:hypothetical protein
MSSAMTAGRAIREGAIVSPYSKGGESAAILWPRERRVKG